MAHAGRDPLWLACMVVALQDSIWAVGNPNAGDLCLRCHTPGGWLAGRSDPPNLTALSTASGDPDFDGINCDLCHRMVDPMSGLRQPDVPPETTPEAFASSFSFQFATLPDRSYQVQYCDALQAGDWQDLGGAIPGDGTTVPITDTGLSGESHRFYRVQSTLDPPGMDPPS